MEEETLSKRQKREMAKEIKKREQERNNLISKLKKWGFLVLALSLSGYSGLKFVRWLSAPVPQGEISQDALGVSDTEWIKGNPTASTTLIEYGDFQCPACASYAPIIKKLNEEFSNNLRIVYRHYPLVTIHANAFDSSRAAEAAGRQGKFWEMHDVLFARQDEWAKDGSPKDKFVAYANELGLNEETFLADFESKEVKDKINADILSGNSLAVDSTPTFYLNGSKLLRVSGYESLKSFIQESFPSE